MGVLRYGIGGEWTCRYRFSVGFLNSLQSDRWVGGLSGGVFL